jgi:hypothetical protein
MRVFTCPARYRAYVESTLAATMREVRLDSELRADDEPRIQRLAGVPDQFIDETETGDLLIMVSIPNADEDEPPEPDLNADNADPGEYAYREAMHDAGRRC